MKNKNGADNLPRHSRRRWSGQGTESRRRRSKPWQTQMEQTTDRDQLDADGAYKAKIVDANRPSYGKHRRTKRLT